MKTVWISILFAIALPASAQETGGSVSFRSASTSSTSILSTAPDYSKNDFTEAGFTTSSINGGSTFATVSLGHEFENGFTLGARGLMPMNFARESQIYLGQVFGRFPFLNAQNILYIEPRITQGFFSAEGGGTNYFAMFGATYGYIRRFKGDFALGINIGADYAPSRPARNQFVSSSAILSQLGLTGGYYF